MFDFLKKKIGGLIDKITKKEEEKPEAREEPLPIQKKEIELSQAKPKEKPIEKYDLPVETPKKEAQKELPKKIKPLKKEKPVVVKPKKEEKPAPVKPEKEGESLPTASEKEEKPIKEAKKEKMEIKKEETPVKKTKKSIEEKTKFKTILKPIPTESETPIPVKPSEVEDNEQVEENIEVHSVPDELSKVEERGIEERETKEKEIPLKNESPGETEVREGSVAIKKIEPTKIPPEPEHRKKSPLEAIANFITGKSKEEKPAKKDESVKEVDSVEIIETKSVFKEPFAKPELETIPEVEPTLEHKSVIAKPETNVETKIQEKEQKKPKERIKLGAVSVLKSIVTREVEITESDINELLENFELELLEADVDISVAETIRESLKERLVGAKIKKGELHGFVTDRIKGILIEMISNEKIFDMVEKVKQSEKPVKILFLGVNGAGKTTTIAKVAKLLLNNNQKVVFAAADTFRAAAIEQMEVHAQRLGVKTIKRDYGSDPTSVAFDAVNYAKAHAIDAVLIDTAGRQDTNISLLNEMKKMTRVIQPDIKVYIGESIAGNAIIEQISSFNNEIGIDAVILTKMDCDPKGGTMLSINKVTGVPIIYVGMGQKYEDLVPFDPRNIVEKILE